MKISFLTLWNGPAENVGYGVAGDGIMAALERMNHSVSYADPTAPVEIAFCQPEEWRWSNPDAYHIGYVPWESTRIPATWPEPMAKADEIWATSPWVAGIYERSGIAVKKVFEHGVDCTIWQRKLRDLDGPIKFLHMGEPAPRKAGQLVFDTFVDLFGDSTTASLTIKAFGHTAIKGVNAVYLDDDGDLIVDPDYQPKDNVTVITEDLPENDLVALVQDHDVLLYPSWGEGFGLIPLQAMATGMPVVCTANWAPYRHLLLTDLALRSRFARSPWPDTDPGNMYEPDKAHLKELMLKLSDPAWYRSAALRSYGNSFNVEVEYDWDKLVSEAFSDVIQKFSS